MKPSRERESRPTQGEATIPGPVRGATPILPTPAPSSAEPPALVLDGGAVLTKQEWRAYVIGHECGYRLGLDVGRGQADEEAARLHHAAYLAVQAAARAPERDHAADERRAATSDRYWSERRGEAS